MNACGMVPLRYMKDAVTREGDPVVYLESRIKKGESDVQTIFSVFSALSRGLVLVEKNTGRKRVERKFVSSAGRWMAD